MATGVVSERHSRASCSVSASEKRDTSDLRLGISETTTLNFLSPHPKRKGRARGSEPMSPQINTLQ